MRQDRDSRPAAVSTRRDVLGSGAGAHPGRARPNPGPMPRGEWGPPVGLLPAGPVDAIRSVPAVGRRERNPSPAGGSRRGALPTGGGSSSKAPPDNAWLVPPWGGAATAGGNGAESGERSPPAAAPGVRRRCGSRVTSGNRGATGRSTAGGWRQRPTGRCRGRHRGDPARPSLRRAAPCGGPPTSRTARLSQVRAVAGTPSADPGALGHLAAPRFGRHPCNPALSRKFMSQLPR